MIDQKKALQKQENENNYIPMRIIGAGYCRGINFKKIVSAYDFITLKEVTISKERLF